MNNSKITYLILFLLTILLGLLSRKIVFLPLATGDTLYAVMVYWGLRCLLPSFSMTHSLLFTLLFCFGIECLQLVDHPLLISWRNHSILRLIYGQGFLWSDLLAYIIGAFVAFLIDRKILSFILKQK